MGKMKGKNHHPVATKVVYAFCVGLSALVFPGCATEAQVRYTIPASEAIREKAVIATRKYLGMPYGWGGRQSWWDEADGSIDCSGLVVNVYKEALQASGFSLLFDDTTAAMLAKAYTQRLRSPEPGDLIFMGDDPPHISHVAICLEDDDASYSFIDAYSIDGIVEQRSYAKNNPKIISFGRILVSPTR